MAKSIVVGSGAPIPSGMHRLTVNIPVEMVGALKNKGVIERRTLTSLVLDGIKHILAKPHGESEEISA